MLTAITDANSIARAQQQFTRQLRKSLRDAKRQYTVGHQGYSVRTRDLMVNGNIWYFHRLLKRATTPRHWNAFGMTSDLDAVSSNSICVEINVALEGAPRKVAALFAQDPKKPSLFLLHRGRIGGGRKGIGQEHFLSYYRGKRVRYVEASGQQSEAILVANISTGDVASQVSQFVSAVRDFKEQKSRDAIAKMSMSALRKKAVTSSNSHPRRRYKIVPSFGRSNWVSEYVKRRADGVCELCRTKAPFLDGKNEAYLECHHIQWLANRGKDSIHNTVALCPNCHRKMHILGHPQDIAMLKLIASKH